MSASSADARRIAEARVGTVLRDKWRIERVLGMGGFGAVYAATHRTGKRVAVKLLHPELSADPDVCKRFLREAYAANAVDHPGAVSVLDDDVTEDGAAFLVMEFLDGESLEARRNRKGGRLPPDEVLSIADKVLDVLAAAHAKGVIHRDIKPDNIFLTRDGTIKLLDFGIARLRERHTGTATTQIGAPMGTPAFMPSEQARGRWELVDGRTDLWSLGATMFTLLSGRFVHGELNAYEALGAAMMKPAPSVLTVVPGLPQPIAAVIDRALAFERDARWPDASAMQAAVRDAYHAAQGAAPLVAPRTSVPDPEEATTVRRESPAVTPQQESSRPAPVQQVPAPVHGSEPGRGGPAMWFGVGIGAALLVSLIVGLLLSSMGAAPSSPAPGAQPSANPGAVSVSPAAAVAVSATPTAIAPAGPSAPSVNGSGVPSGPASAGSVSASPSRSGTTAPRTKQSKSPMATPY